MNKAQFVTAVASIAGTSKSDVEKVVDATFDVIGNAMKEGDEIRLVNFGIFTSLQQAAKEARNPRTGEKIAIPARRVPKFKPGKQLKDKVEGK